MKKLILTLSIVSFLLSCNNSEVFGNKKYYSISITNNSTRIVSYTYNKISDTLTVSETKKYEVETYTQPPENVIDQFGIESIKCVKKDLVYTISDLKPYNLNAKSKLPVDVKIKSDNYIDDNESPILTIEANTEKTVKIYTTRPNFKSITNYPFVIDWNIIGDTMYVTTSK